LFAANSKPLANPKALNKFHFLCEVFLRISLHQLEDDMTIKTSQALLVVIAGLLSSARGQSLPNLFPFLNASGVLETYNAGGKSIDLTGPFFQSLGTNGRSCGSCHQPAQGWGISAGEVKTRFELTQGLDPIFRTNDGSNCDHNIDTSTVGGRRQAYSLLINKGLIRIAIQMPSTAEFNVVSVVNPYGCGDPSTLSMYRRPLPSTNLRFLSTIMWDGRESSTQTGTQKITFPTNPGDLLADLAHQAVDATNIHAQATATLTSQQQQEIVNLEMALITAQAIDYRAGALNADGASGGPSAIYAQTIPAFFIGINDPLGGNPHGTPFTPVIFNLYDAWANLRSQPFVQVQRASIVRGQALFNSKPINITGVAGLNDDLNLPSIPGTCGTCHDSPNIGNHSVSAPLNIGVGDVTSPLDVSYLPVFTLQNKTTLEIKTTTDPGRALITGAWKDVGRLKGPILRGLPSRAPYFHNGSADSLTDVVNFYDTRFNIGFTPQEEKDLIAFLNTL
jgi:cytochrome c peroxidase